MITTTNLVSWSWTMPIQTTGMPASIPKSACTATFELVAWGEGAGILTTDQADRLRRLANRLPEEASDSYQRAIEFREALYRIFSAISNGDHVEKGDLAILNTLLDLSLGHQQIISSPGGFAWSWDDDPDLERVTLAGGAVGCRFAHFGAFTPCAALRRRTRLRLPFYRHKPQPQPALVFDGILRQPGKSQAPLCPPERSGWLSIPGSREGFRWDCAIICKH